MTTEITIFTRSYIFKWWFFHCHVLIPQKERTHVISFEKTLGPAFAYDHASSFPSQKNSWKKYYEKDICKCIKSFTSFSHPLCMFECQHRWCPLIKKNEYMTNYVYTYWSTCIPYIFMYIYTYVLINETPTFKDSHTHTHTSKTCLWKIHHLLQIWATCTQVQASCRWESLLSRLRFGEFSWCDFLSWKKRWFTSCKITVHLNLPSLKPTAWQLQKIRGWKTS